jgi:preprotein translocase subunit SecA
MRQEAVDEIVDGHIPEKAYPEEWDIEGLTEAGRRVLGVDLPIAEWAQEEGIADEEIRERIAEAADRHIAGKVARYGADLWRLAEKSLLLQLLDQSWKDHLLSLDHLRQGIGLRAYGQRDPLNEYRREAFNMFETMLGSLREQVTQLLAHVELRVDEPESVMPQQREQEMHETRQDPAFAGEPPPPEQLEDEALAVAAAGGGGAGGGGALAPEAAADRGQTVRHAAFDHNDPSTWTKVGRNAPCPCGSGKKYKHCHGKLA